MAIAAAPDPRPAYSEGLLVALLAHYDELAAGRFSLDAGSALDQVLLLGSAGTPRLRKRVHVGAPFESPICAKVDIDDALKGLDGWQRLCVWGHGVVGYPLGHLSGMFGTDVGRVQWGYRSGIRAMLRHLNRPLDTL